MRVLLTNNTLGARAGSELYLRDVAVELMRRGHRPVAYSTSLGAVAAELEAATVPVIQSLDSLGEAPDIIHGQHHYETLSAMLRYPETPAIYYCHGWTPWQEAPLRFPRILRYVAVDEVCRERLIVEGGIPPAKIELLLNFFDARLFPRRTPLPVQPRLALAFSNTFGENSDLPVLREACAQCGIEVHATGLGVGQSEGQAGQLLQKYDLVFARARSAIEAMAVGGAVILCSPGRLGSMVSSGNFSNLRPLNFGIRALDRPLELELLVSEIRRYDARDSEQVSTLARSECELQPAVDRLIAVYEEVLEEARHTPPAVSAGADHAAARYLEQHAARYKGFVFEAEREQWRQRCLLAEADREELRAHGAEQALALSQALSRAEENRHAAQLSHERAEAYQQQAEGNRRLAEANHRQAEANEQQADANRRLAETNRQLIEARQQQAEANRQLAEQRQQALTKLDQDWQGRFDLSNSRWRSLLEETESRWNEQYIQSTRLVSSLEHEMEEMRGWPAWQATKWLLESLPMRLCIRPAARAVRRQWRLLASR
jgi:hypothetical protein